MSGSASGKVLGFREHQILRLVEADLAHEGKVRSFREIALALGMARNHAADSLRRLERRGLLSRVGAGRGRQIVLNGNFAEVDDPVLSDVHNERELAT